MKFLSILALAASATAAAVNKRGGEWNTWEASTVTVTVWATTTQEMWATTTCYETVTEWQTTTEYVTATEWNKWQ